jgi:ATP-dependent Lon protease
VERGAAEMKTSILIVDDEENLLVLLDRILSKDGFQVKTATNAYQALKLLENENFNLAILDIKMFPIDGITLLVELRRRSPTTRVIMVTAYSTPDSRSECIKQGAAMFLTKPLDLNQLKSAAHSLAPG